MSIFMLPIKLNNCTSVDVSKAFNPKGNQIKFFNSDLCESFASVVVNFFNTRSTKNSQRTPRFKKNKISFSVEFCLFTFETTSSFRHS